MMLQVGIWLQDIYKMCSYAEENDTTTYFKVDSYKNSNKAIFLKKNSAKVYCWSINLCALHQNHKES